LPDDRLLQRPIIHRCTPLAGAAPELLLLLLWFPCCYCWQVWYSGRRAASGDIERGSLCPEDRSSAVWWERSVKRCQIRVQVGHGCEQGAVVVVVGRGDLRVFRLSRLCLASQILLFRIFCDGGEAGWLRRDPSAGICQPHRSPEYKLVPVQRF